MMNERRALYRQLQHYFESQLFGLYRWHEVRHRPPEKVQIERDERGRKVNETSLGQLVEQAVIDFDGYTLMIKSANESPPQGQITLMNSDPAGTMFEAVSGTISPATWNEVTEVLRRNLDRGKPHG